ncbi:MAG: hypothetical protein L0099_06150 [Acidobacteria bacterium]|nr:hypothetical protein [Acidobacteriota bacterium]
MTRIRNLVAAGFLTLFLASTGLADTPQTQRMTSRTRYALVRALSSEFVYVRKPFPMGHKGLVVKPDGTMTPGSGELGSLLIQHGTAARPGDRVKITNVQIRESRIVFEINGGPKKKKKWYQRVQFSGLGGTASAPQDPSEFSRGSAVSLEFKNYVPELTLARVKQMLEPVFDFTAKSAVQAYMDALPPKVKEAVRDQRVLVGMNREMVQHAKGRPPRKIREKEGDLEYEEWIYGEPPEDVEFIRLVGDEVVQVKIMKMAGEKIVRTEKEVFLEPDTASVAAATPAEAQPETPPPGGPQGKPTLRRPGEPVPETPRGTGGPVIVPDGDTVDPDAPQRPSGPPPPPQFRQGVL